MSEVNQEEYLSDLEVVVRALRATVRCVAELAQLAEANDARVADARRADVRRELSQAAEAIDRLGAHLSVAKVTADLTYGERVALLSRLGVSEEEQEHDDD